MMLRRVLFVGVTLVLVGVLLLPLVTAGGGSGGFKPHKVGRHKHDRKHHTPKTKAEGGGILDDDQLLQDKEHLHEDLKGQLSEDQINNLNPNELEYHYFKAHDFDNNYKLDGLELMAALGHVMQHGGEGEEGEEGEEEEGEGLDMKQLPIIEEMIDDVLRDGDRNKDGFLNYGEYKLGRNQGKNKDITRP